MSAPTILYEAHDGYAVVTLNRPSQLNSFTAGMHAELRDALTRAASSTDVRALLVTGAGRGFCAGQDLADLGVGGGDQPPADLGVTIGRDYNPLVRTLQTLEMPVVCAVNGVAAGAGANIALACDLVLAARSASFIQAFCKIGLVPDSGGTYFLPRLIGTARAMGLAMLGDKLSAERAEAIGLIWKCVDDDKLMSEAHALTKHLATQPTRALAAIKRAIHAAAGNDLAAQLDLERDIQRELGASHDYREGVAAFLAKRAPQFTGR